MIMLFGGLMYSCTLLARPTYTGPAPSCLHFLPHARMQMDEFEFEEGEVYAIDIIISTGEGKIK
jgi:hypothetical protein